MNNAAEQFSIFLEQAKIDENVLAFWLCGSRGKGIVTDHSDYDCMMIVKDEAVEGYKTKYQGYGLPEIEVVGIFTLDEFKQYAAWDSPMAWDRYNFAHLKPLVDKTGQVQAIFDERATIPADKVEAFVSDKLGGFINQVYRSLKCLRDGNQIAARLESAESIYILLDVVFALHGKVKPYYKYLSWELEGYPLERLPWSPSDFIAKLTTVLDSADITTQQELLVGVEKVARAQGYDEAFDEWGEKLDWMKTYAK